MTMRLMLVSTEHRTHRIFCSAASCDDVFAVSHVIWVFFFLMNFELNWIREYTIQLILIFQCTVLKEYTYKTMNCMGNIQLALDTQTIRFYFIPFYSCRHLVAGMYERCAADKCRRCCKWVSLFVLYALVPHHALCPPSYCKRDCVCG